MCLKFRLRRMKAVAVLLQAVELFETKRCITKTAPASPFRIICYRLFEDMPNDILENYYFLPRASSEKKNSEKCSKFLVLHYQVYELRCYPLIHDVTLM